MTPFYADSTVKNRNLNYFFCLKPSLFSLSLCWEVFRHRGNSFWIRWGLKIFQKFFCNDSSPGIDAEFHFTDFFVDIFHKLDDEVD